MLEDIISAIPLGVFLAFMVGPVFFVLLETAALRGFRAAFTFDLGVILADVFFLCIAYFSTSQLLKSIKDDPALFIFGGSVLVVYALISYLKVKKATYTTADFEVQKLKRKDYISIFIKGFLLNFINIGVLGFWLGLLIIFGPTLNMEPSRMITFFSTILITYLVIDILKILLAKRLKNSLTPKRVVIVKKLISFVLLIFGVVLVIRGLFPDDVKQIENQFEKTKLTPISVLNDKSH
ncbi:Threonine/homoserine/homoserine lactone efflux protein [Psychroflexus salarius]|uniref:Threonine/homoserine/homoserine lactone efflux protein n=1 Tax=Psychroflexus salarius TaxID=1155689 RepID=A0A1M4VGX0_9FLAO|nr:LysE family transporter [Psychroflexus salarius]SHE68229.1 Threonine/homoserine/homoserine lactone efflux protein [Psychroflexus salarius]